MDKGLSDDQRLAELGYKSEMPRTLSMWSMLGLAYSILNCWVVMGSSFVSAFTTAGAASLIWGWIGVCFFSFCVAASMGELTSRYSTAVGQPFWAYCTLPASSRRWISYMTGWSMLTGLVGMGSSAVFAVANDSVGMAILCNPGYEFKAWHSVLIAWLAIIFMLLFNIFGVKHINKLSLFAMWWSIVGFIVSIVVLFACGSPNFTSGKFVFTSYTNESGWTSKGVAVLLGVTQSAYTMACYDAPAHVSEEGHADDAPRVMLYSVLIGFITTLIYLFAVLFNLHNIQDVADSTTGLPILQLYYNVTGSKVGTCFLMVFQLLSQMFAESALLTETSRSVMAFSRDGGLPFAPFWAHVNKKMEVPLNALLLVAFAQAAIMAIYFGSSTAFLTVISIASIGLFFSYLIPIMSMMLYGRSHGFVPGKFSLGKWGFIINLCSVLYLILMVVWFFIPTRYPVTASNMNWAIVALGVVLLLSITSWVFYGKKYYMNHDAHVVEGLITKAEQVEILAQDAVPETETVPAKVG